MKHQRAAMVRTRLSGIRTTEIALQRLLDQGFLRGYAEAEVSQEVRRLRRSREAVMSIIDDDQRIGKAGRA